MPRGDDSCRHSSETANSRHKMQHYRGSDVQSVESDVFLRADRGPLRACPGTTTLSRIPAPTAPHHERQCHIFLRGAQIACGSAVSLDKCRYLRGFREVPSSGQPPNPHESVGEDHNTVEGVRPGVAKVTCFISDFEVSSSPMSVREDPYRRAYGDWGRGPPSFSTRLLNTLE